MIMPFRFWCQKVLPLVYDDSLSYYELLCKVVNHLNSMGEEVNHVEEDLINLKNYVDTYFDSLDVEKVVEDKITEMVNAGEFDDVFTQQEINSSIDNIYIADYIKEDETDLTASAVAKVGDKFYSIISYKTSYRIDNHSDTGYVKIMEISDSQNRFVSETEIEVGHGNSICYDRKNERFLIVPIDTCASGSAVSVRRIISYDEYFTDNSKTYIETPETPYGISCDENGNVYLLTYWNHIYILNSDDTFTKVCDVSPSLEKGTGAKQKFDYNQGFAVQDGLFYVSTGYGVIAYGRLSTGKILGYRTVSDMDMSGTRMLGELEDFEFGTDGALYAQRYFFLEDTVCDATIVELPVKEVVNEPYNVPFHDHNNTFYITDASVSHPKNNNGVIKHPAQINMIGKRISISTLSINTSHEFGKIVLDASVMVAVTKLICRQIIIFNNVSIYGNASNSITFTDATVENNSHQYIRIQRTGSLTLCGNRLNVITPETDLVIGVAQFKSMSVLRAIPAVKDADNNSYDLYMEEVAITHDNSLWIGTNEVYYAPTT